MRLIVSQPLPAHPLPPCKVVPLPATAHRCASARPARPPSAMHVAAVAANVLHGAVLPRLILLRHGRQRSCHQRCGDQKRKSAHVPLRAVMREIRSPVRAGGEGALGSFWGLFPPLWRGCLPSNAQRNLRRSSRACAGGSYSWSYFSTLTERRLYGSPLIFAKG